MSWTQLILFGQTPNPRSQNWLNRQQKARRSRAMPLSCECLAMALTPFSPISNQSITSARFLAWLQLLKTNCTKPYVQDLSKSFETSGGEAMMVFLASEMQPSILDARSLLHLLPLVGRKITLSVSLSHTTTHALCRSWLRASS